VRLTTKKYDDEAREAYQLLKAKSLTAEELEFNKEIE